MLELMTLVGRYLDVGAIPTTSTINTFTECAYDGGEQVRQVYEDQTRRQQNTNANENFALAA